MNRSRRSPLDRLPSLRLRLGLLIVLAISVTLGTMLVAGRLGLQLRLGAVVALVLSLATVQVVARGTTRPLRILRLATERIADGETDVRVEVTGRDEVAAVGHAFNAMAARLEETDRIRRDLVADAAHELRTPIGALRAVLENAVDGIAPADPDELLAQVRRLGVLADQLLDLSRLDAGAAPLRRRDVPVAELFAEPLAAHGVGADASGVVVGPATTISDGLTLDVPAGLRLHGDPERLRQVVANLLGNAARHAEGAPVLVRARGTPTGGVRIVVEDGGPGIDPADLERVFDRFARADRSRTTPGSGLGLAIARSIVELHSGTIHAEPAEPRGCRIVVDLP